MQAAIPGNTISLSKSSDTGATWAPLENGPQGAAIDVSPHPSDPLKLVVLAESGVFRSTDGGSTWTQSAVMPFATALGRSPVSAGLLYAAFNFGQVSVSIDDGVRCSTGTTVYPRVDQQVGSPTSASTIYAFSRTSSYRYFYQSTNGGATWKAASLTGLPAADFQSLVTVGDGTYYLAVASGIASRNGLFKSTDGGGTWASVTAGLPAALHPGQHSIAVAGTTIYYAQGGVYRSTDAGANWTLLATAPDSAGIAVSSQDRSMLYAITTAGTLQSTTDGGTTWSADATGLPKDLDLLSSAFAIASPSARSATRAQIAIFAIRGVLGGDNFTYSGSPTLATRAPRHLDSSGFKRCTSWESRRVVEAASIARTIGLPARRLRYLSPGPGWVRLPIVRLLTRPPLLLPMYRRRIRSSSGFSG